MVEKSAKHDVEISRDMFTGNIKVFVVILPVTSPFRLCYSS